MMHSYYAMSKEYHIFIFFKIKYFKILYIYVKLFKSTLEVYRKIVIELSNIWREVLMVVVVRGGLEPSLIIIPSPI